MERLFTIGRPRRGGGEEERREFSVGNLSFEQLKRLKRQSEIQRSDEDEEEAKEETRSREEKEEERDWNDRSTKNVIVRRFGSKLKPLEVSSKRPQAPPVNTFTVLKKHKQDFRDPRFSDFSGHLNLDLFAKSYDFLNSWREEEKRNLKRIARSGENASCRTSSDEPQQKRIPKAVKERAEKLYCRMESQDAQRRKDAAQAKIRRELLKNERQKIIERGKAPYFFNKAKIKRITEERKFEELKTEKKKDSYLRKKERRISEKKSKFIPIRRDKSANEI